MKKKYVIILSAFLLLGCSSKSTVNNSTSINDGNSSNGTTSTSSDNSVSSTTSTNSESATNNTSSITQTSSTPSSTVNSTTSYISTSDRTDDYFSYVPKNFLSSKTEIDSYYSTITSDLKGDNLQNKLQSIIFTHTKLSYDSLEESMRISDRDWSKSPNEDDANPFMKLLYYTKNDDSKMMQTWNKYYSGNNPTANQMWDKEHIWAKSNGFPSKSKMAYSDLHHLRASDRKNNNSRSNYPFAEAETITKRIADFSNTNSGILGKCKGVTIYEPLDEYKGDVARALFYMATCYKSSDGIALSLTDGTNSSSGKWGFVSTLLKWNKEDLPDAYEVARNDIIYKELQHNRNPFIDHPEYADRIYGNI